MPKTTAASPAQALAEEVERLQAAIFQKERQLLEQQTENGEMAEALKIFNTDIARYVPEGRVGMLDAINALMDESFNQQDREYRLNLCQKALMVGQEAAATLQTQLEDLRQQLAFVLGELDWQQNYAPFVERYRSGFVVPSPADIKAQKVQALERDIADRQLKLQRAQAWLSEPEGSRSYYPGDALREVQYLGEAIAFKDIYSCDNNFYHRKNTLKA